MIEAGISSSYHIAKFFGLTDRIRQPEDKPMENLKPVSQAILASSPEPLVKAAPARKVRTAGDRRAEPRGQPSRRTVDINAVITRALTAAGLIKNGDPT